MSDPKSRGYVQIEWMEARLAGREKLTPCALVATLIFRRQEDIGSLRTVTPARS